MYKYLKYAIKNKNEYNENENNDDDEYGPMMNIETIENLICALQTRVLSIEVISTLKFYTFSRIMLLLIENNYNFKHMIELIDMYSVY